MVGRLEICRAFQAHCHCTICCALKHIRKTQDEATLGVGLYITYRDILNIGSYNWQLQEGLLKHRFGITIYLYRAIQYHAVLPVKNCTPISLYLHTCYNPIQVYLV